MNLRLLLFAIVLLVSSKYGFTYEEPVQVINWYIVKDLKYETNKWLINNSEILIAGGYKCKIADDVQIKYFTGNVISKSVKCSYKRHMFEIVSLCDMEYRTIPLFEYEWKDAIYYIYCSKEKE